MELIGFIFDAIKLGITEARMQSISVMADTSKKVLIESKIGMLDII
jgi:hypothetical protein